MANRCWKCFRTKGLPKVKRESPRERAVAREVAILLAVMGAALFVRCWGILDEPFGVDETESLVHIAEPSYGEFLKGFAGALTPPMPAYFRIVYFLYHWVYPDGLAPRLFSVFVGVMTVPILYLLARRIGGLVAARIAAFVFALSPFCAFYSQEVRMSVMLPFYAIVSAYALLRAVDGQKLWGWWALHVLANLLLAFTNFLAASFWLSEAAYLLIFHFRRRGLLVSWCTCHVLLLAAVVAWLRTTNTEGLVDLLKSVSCSPLFLTVPSMLVYLAGGMARRQDPRIDVYFPTSSDLALAVLVYGLIAWFAIRTFARRGQCIVAARRDIALLLMWFTLPIVFMAAVTSLGILCFWCRYLTACSAALAILTGLSLSAIQSRRRRCALTVLVLGLYAWQGFLFLDAPHRTNYAAAAQYLMDNRKEGDILIDCRLGLPVYRMYCPAWPSESIRTIRPKDLETEAPPVLAQNQRVWLVLVLWMGNEDWQEGMQFLKSYKPAPRMKEFRSWSPIRVYLFERGDSFDHTDSQRTISASS